MILTLISTLMIGAMAKMVQLTPRQRQALDMVALDMRNCDIAARLGISERAVEGLLTRIYRSMRVRSRVGAVLGWTFMRAQRLETLD